MSLWVSGSWTDGVNSKYTYYNDWWKAKYPCTIYYTLSDCEMAIYLRQIHMPTLTKCLPCTRPWGRFSVHNRNCLVCFLNRRTHQDIGLYMCFVERTLVPKRILSANGLLRLCRYGHTNRGCQDYVKPRKYYAASKLRYITAVKGSWTYIYPTANCSLKHNLFNGPYWANQWMWGFPKISYISTASIETSAS